MSANNRDDAVRLPVICAGSVPMPPVSDGDMEDRIAYPSREGSGSDSEVKSREDRAPDPGRGMRAMAGVSARDYEKRLARTGKASATIRKIGRPKA